MYGTGKKGLHLGMKLDVRVGIFTCFMLVFRVKFEGVCARMTIYESICLGVAPGIVYAMC